MSLNLRSTGSLLRLDNRLELLCYCVQVLLHVIYFIRLQFHYYFLFVRVFNFVLELPKYFTFYVLVYLFLIVPPFLKSIKKLRIVTS